VPEVLDCWFESGSMPWAQVHYPFENKDWFEHHFPADFIVEYVAQTRGWFYTLVVLATALFDKPPFRNCMCHGVLLDEQGSKLSKSLRNYPDPEQLFKTTGSDALRWFLMSGPVLRGADLRIDKEGKQITEVVRLVLNPIWNAYYFFTLYANVDGVRARERTDQQELLDRYALAKTNELVTAVQQAMEDYDLAAACAVVVQYLDALNNWYIRRSRARFWGETTPADRQDAYDTLFTCLVTLCRVAAPLLPLLTEYVHRGLTGHESVHLEDWPDAARLPVDRALVARMDLLRDACSQGLMLREERKLRTRLPLQQVTLAGPGAAALRDYAQLLQDELNCKQVAIEADASAYGTQRLLVDGKTLGPKLGPKMKDVLAATKSGAWRVLADGRADVGGVVLERGDFTLHLQPRDGVAAAALRDGVTMVVLDTRTTPALARDFVRLVQQLRKDSGLHVSDRIRVAVVATGEVAAALRNHQRYVADQVLAVEFTFAAPAPGMTAGEGTVGSGDGQPVRFGIARA
jgi:isoleucyl-tRNA synthetase